MNRWPATRSGQPLRAFSLNRSFVVRENDLQGRVVLAGQAADGCGLEHQFMGRREGAEDLLIETDDHPAQGLADGPALPLA